MCSTFSPMRSNGSRTKLLPRGFSILEVLITLAIIGLITALVLVKYGAFNNSVLLKSQAYQIGLDIREAQVYATSVRNADDAELFRQDVGVYFSTAASQQYVPFSDQQTTVPVVYNGGDQIIGKVVSLDSRLQIRSLCVNGCSQQVNNLSVSFKRPDFDAQFGVSGGPGSITDATIVLGDTKGSAQTRTVSIGPTGQITIQ